MKSNFKIENRKARYNYFIEDTYQAGIVLKGSEVKSIRAGRVNITEAYCYFKDNELFLRNSHITSMNNTMFGHQEICDRKLLLSRKELRKLQKMTMVKGYTIIPLFIFVPVKGFIKVTIAICQGKHNYDKRETIKERDYQRGKY